MDRVEEDEIDLRDLFRTIWNKKLFILIFTSVVTLIAIIYAYSKTPIFEVKSVVRVGYINDNLLVDSDILVQKLKSVYNVGTSYIKNDNAITSNIKTIKDINNFIEIYTQSHSNSEAEILNKKIIEFIKKDYEYKIENYKFQIDTDIKNINNQISIINNIEKENIIRNINKLKKHDIINIEQKIKYINTVEIKKINDKIDFIKNSEIKAIIEKISFYEKKLSEYEKNVNNMLKNKSDNSTANLLKGMQLSTLQNIILDVQNNITNLKKEKEKQTNIILKDLEIDKKNLIDIKVRDLLIAKDNIINDKIKKLENQLNIEIPDKIYKLKDKISFEKNKLNNISNSTLVGSFVKNDHPIMPKKKLIVVVAFVTGFILSIFIVFFMSFITGIKNESKKEEV